MIFTDSHCHLTMSDSEGALARARAGGVGGFVVPGTTLEDAPQAVAVAQGNEDVWAAVGFHPHEAKDCHLDLARRMDKPIIVHNRESTDDMVSILTASQARGILHSFTESEEVARKFIKAGYFISFSGIITFRSAGALRSCAKALPHDRVLIETDTPFLAPVPFRGRDNEPAYVVKVAELLATLWGVPLDEVAARTTANFESAFGVTLPR
jgi:TatD DNase family protein